MRYLVIALALFAVSPSQADETDLPVWYKEKALLKSYNSLVKRANLRRSMIIRLCECDPSDENIALAKATPVLSEVDKFKDVPEKFQDYESKAISDEKKKIREEKDHYFRLLIECQRAEKSTEG